jgi:hypothetical protein
MLHLNPGIEPAAKKWDRFVLAFKSRTNFSLNFVRGLSTEFRGFSATTMQSNPGKRTDAKADDLVQNAFNYRSQRSELVAKCYGRVKDSLGAIEGARFIQIENQLLAIIDLQIASALPQAGPTKRQPQAAPTEGQMQAAPTKAFR